MLAYERLNQVNKKEHSLAPTATAATSDQHATIPHKQRKGRGEKRRSRYELVLLTMRTNRVVLYVGKVELQRAKEKRAHSKRESGHVFLPRYDFFKEKLLRCLVLFGVAVRLSFFGGGVVVVVVAPLRLWCLQFFCVWAVGARVSRKEGQRR